MSTPNSDEWEGKFKKAKGTVKDKAGEMTGDKELEAEGEVEHTEGETQETWGKFKRGVGDAAEAVEDTIRGDKK
jgi:uncharacterized protein YjbJ (UPF0337 family)